MSEATYDMMVMEAHDAVLKASLNDWPKRCNELQAIAPRLYEMYSKTYHYARMNLAYETRKARIELQRATASKLRAIVDKVRGKS